MRAMSGLRRALGEPLLQFIVMGALLFAGYRLVHPERPAEAKGNRVELTADDVRQLEIVWTAQWRRAPTPGELQGLVESRVRQEILYREALALGLERGDTIIKRRLAQKMEFLADDLSAVRTPSAEELRAWYSRNSGGSRTLVAVPSDTCTFPRTAVAIVRSRTPRVRWSSSADARRCPRSRPSATRSCSRSTTPIARRSRWQPSSAVTSPRPCASCRSARGRGRLSRASGGIWCSSRPRRPVAFRPSTRSGRDPGGVDGGPKVGSAAAGLRRDEGALRGAIASAVPRAQ